MSRTLRVQFPGAIYHVTSRGISQQDIFFDDSDRSQFWCRVRDTVIRHRWEMYAATLMTNHFHLFFKTILANLSRGMQYLLSGYANWFNRRHSRQGHLFQGRFRGHLIENESYFWTVSRYVHLNPVPVIVPRPEDWPWSTYGGYLDVERRWDWVAYEALLDTWQGEFGSPDAIERYRTFVEQGLDETMTSPFGTAIDGWILGSQDFADRIREQLQPEWRRQTLASKSHIDADQLLAATCNYFDVLPLQLAERGKRHPGRVVLAVLAQRHAGLTLAQIAPFVGLSRGDCVPYLLKRAATAPHHSGVSEAIRQIEQRLGLR